MRTFAAIELAEEAKNKIVDMSQRLANIDETVRWVKPENVHVTLYFFGEVEESGVRVLSDIINTAIHRISPFTINIQGISAFPTVKRARVLWFGIQNEGRELSEMYEKIRRGLLETGIAGKVEARPYSPHLTVGRVKRGISRKLIDQINKYNDFQFGHSEVKELVLFESILMRPGPVYKKIKSFPLQNR
jgi:2'-5' RNA ligase